MKYNKTIRISIGVILLLLSTNIYAHGVDDSTKNFLSSIVGVEFFPLLYIGAKHMITGYDHILFLIGVVFFLYKVKDIVIYVSYFTIGHSVTLLLGVLFDVQMNAYIIDAIIALSIVYKGFDNLGGFEKIFNYQPNTKKAVLIFGLFHGLGLATKLQEFEIPQEGLLMNLIGFNIGVEVGQFLALLFVVIVMGVWRKYSSFNKFATIANVAIMAAGFTLIGLQLGGYFVNK
ncbi:MAG: HupE/UreJ family protein [Flavobacteriaceae bacterium]|nr:HupE/UreJ family protein [Flavobacteriaceae bacterium]